MGSSASSDSAEHTPTRRAASSTANASGRCCERHSSTAQRAGGRHGSPRTSTMSFSGSADSWVVMPRRLGTTAPAGTVKCTVALGSTPKPYRAAAV